MTAHSGAPEPAADLAPDTSPDVAGSGAGERIRRIRERFEGSQVGRLQRRVVEVQLTKQALILAALALMLVIPALVTLAAVLPLGTADGTFGAFARRIGLSPQAAHDLQQLFPSRTTVRSASTWFGAALTVVLTVRWPMALQRAYEIVWGLPAGGLRTLGRSLVWICGFVAIVAAAALVDPVLHGVVWLVAIVLLGTPLVVGWAWWTQHMLLGGRIGWRPLLPGAVVVGLGLVGLRLAAGVALSPAITTHYQEYGPLGIVFMMLSWFVAFSVVMLGGAVVGHLVVASLAAPTLTATSPADPGRIAEREGHADPADSGSAVVLSGGVAAGVGVRRRVMT